MISAVYRLEAAPSWQVPRPYEVLSTIGAGGMVYRMRDTKVETAVMPRR